MRKIEILEIETFNLEPKKNFNGEKNCELELFRSRIFNSQFLKFVGFGSGSRKVVMHKGEFRDRNGYEEWLGVNTCMGMRMGLHGNENELAWTGMGLQGWEFRERNGYEGWLGVNMCMGLVILGGVGW